MPLPTSTQLWRRPQLDMARDGCCGTSTGIYLVLSIALLKRSTLAVTIEDQRLVNDGRKHVHGEIDPDEYLWSKLPGRCCFETSELCSTPDAPRSECTKQTPNTCRACGVWSTPENYCHGSAETCLSCGMSLFCPSPPPLLDGNKVCTGASRVSTGCYDGMATGLCAGQTESDCEAACRKSEACELFVYFPEEMKGSCVLCSDLFSYERTPGAAARAYAVLAARSPQVPPGLAPLSNLAVLPDPSPPSPAVSSLELASPPATYPFLGRHKTGKPAVYVDCTFAPGVEYTTSRLAGYKDGKATTKEECCKQCGHLEMGCTHFIFEPSDGVCVLLPSISKPTEFGSNDNELVISGTASVGIVAAGAEGFDASRCWGCLAMG